MIQLTLTLLAAQASANADLPLFDAHDALSRLEATWAAAPEAERDAAHARADAALDAWNAGDRSKAFEEWTRLRLELEGMDDPWDVALASLRLEFVDGGVSARSIRRRWSFSGFGGGEARLRLVQRFPTPEVAGEKIAGEIHFEKFMFGPEPGDEWESVFNESGELLPTTFTVGLPAVPPAVHGIALVACGELMDWIPAENVPLGEAHERLDELADLGSSIVDRIFHSRMGLVVQEPSLDRSAEFLVFEGRVLAFEGMSLDMRERHDAIGSEHWGVVLRREAEHLEAKKPRYRGAAGPMWRTFAHGDEDLAMWVAQPSKEVKVRPLIVALHGDGFDEGWFAHLAGSGSLLRLGPELGAVVAAPRTPDLVANPDVLGSLIDDLVELGAVDRERVYLLGHGSGAAAAVRLARLQPDLVAGVACIAAPDVEVEGEYGPPVVIVVGEHEGAGPDRDPTSGGASVTVVRAAGAGRVLGLERSFAAALDALGVR